MTNRIWLGAAAGAGLLALVAAPGEAEAAFLTSWQNITNNGNSNVGGQLSVEYTDVGGTQVKFRFTNAVGIASSITDVYWDDKTAAVLALPLSLASSAGVAFNTPATPGNLPGGAGVGFNATAGFTADSNAPVSANGVNAAAEWLDVTFFYAAGKTLADVTAELASGELVLGMHIQAIGTTGGSDSYINNPNGGGFPIPEPASIALLGAGLLGLGLARRRRRTA